MLYNYNKKYPNYQITQLQPIKGNTQIHAIWIHDYVLGYSITALILEVPSEGKKL